MGDTDKSDCVRFIDATMSIYNQSMIKLAPKSGGKSKACMINCARKISLTF